MHETSRLVLPYEAQNTSHRQVARRCEEVRRWLCQRELAAGESIVPEQVPSHRRKNAHPPSQAPRGTAGVSSKP